VKVRDVAATIIERFTGYPAADPPPFQGRPVPLQHASGQA
jgi:hypothetical protein